MLSCESTQHPQTSHPQPVHTDTPPSYASPSRTPTPQGKAAKNSSSAAKNSSRFFDPAPHPHPHHGCHGPLQARREGDGARHRCREQGYVQACVWGVRVCLLDLVRAGQKKNCAPFPLGMAWPTTATLFLLVAVPSLPLLSPCPCLS